MEDSITTNPPALKQSQQGKRQAFILDRFADKKVEAGEVKASLQKELGVAVAQATVYRDLEAVAEKAEKGYWIIPGRSDEEISSGAE
jgi:hypothetical protein